GTVRRGTENDVGVDGRGPDGGVGQPVAAAVEGEGRGDRRPTFTRPGRSPTGVRPADARRAPDVHSLALGGGCPRRAAGLRPRSSDSGLPALPPPIARPPGTGLALPPLRPSPPALPVNNRAGLFPTPLDNVGWECVYKKRTDQSVRFSRDRLMEPT